ncbi:MAG: metallophosphoesterase family protein [Candidatus Nanopelagicus sp.]
MKILFTADVHIKLGQKNVPVDWARNRFNLFIEQFAEMQNQADLVIIGGDVFDRLPTMDEVELYFDFVESFTKPTLIYPGNHEMLKKDTTFLTYLKKSTQRLNPLVSMIDEYYENLDFGVDIIPYNKLKDFEKYGCSLKNRILCTHVRGEIAPHVKPEVDLEIFKRWDIVLAGDLHSYENSQLNILYPGSPYTTSFHRNPVDTGAILLDGDTLAHVWLKFQLPQLIKKTITADEAVAAIGTAFDHTIYEVEGDMQELGELADSELIATKVLKRDTDSALMLDPEMSLDAEVKEYLTYILELPEITVDKVLQEMQNHAEKFT